MAPDAQPLDGDTGTSPRAQEVVNGVPLGYERTEEGAVLAATAFARVMSAASADVDRYRSAMETLAAASWRNRAQELAANGSEFVRDRYGVESSIVFVPIRYRVAEYSADRATIEIWGVTLATGPKVNGMEESWVTGTIQLTWTGDWRVAGGRSETGPTPELLEAEQSLPFSVLDRFEEYSGAPIP